MADAHQWETLPLDEVESRFLELLENRETPRGELLPALKRARRDMGAEQADGMADMLCESSIQRGDKAGLVDVLQTWAAWHEDNAFSRLCLERLTIAAGKERLFNAFVQAAGFTEGLPAAEALRRLGVLMALRPGVHCMDGTWGFGVVKRIDEFYGKVAIDFDRKPAHQMTFGYAAQTLRVLTPDHLYARRCQDPDGLRRLATDAPAELVRLALSSLGPMSVPRLQEVLTEGMVDEADWKRFWAEARKALKQDACVEIPAKRSDPILLRQTEKAYDDDWFETFRSERIRETILERLTEFETATGATVLTERQRAIVGDRLAFALRGAENADPALAARLLMAAAKFGVDSGSVDIGAWACRFTAPALLKTVLPGLPARETAAWLQTLAVYARAALIQSLLAVFTDLPPAVLDEVWACLEALEAKEEALRLLGGLTSERRTGTLLTCWLARRPEWVLTHGVTDAATLFCLAMEALEPLGSGERLKAQKQLRELFVDPHWLKTVLCGLDDRSRQHMFKRVEISQAWDPSSRRSVMARMIKLYPDLTATGDRDAAQNGARTAVRLTSWRSLRERQEQFRKLIEEDIPANSRDIGVARSYGDLRENFEYQAAKDQQRLLLRRQAEIDADLNSMMGTDFRDASTETAGMGVEVEVEQADGTFEVYRILGEWDRDETLRIVASRSLLAERLAGHRIGDEVALPVAGGPDATCRLRAVRPLPPEVLQWLQS